MFSLNSDEIISRINQHGFIILKSNCEFEKEILDFHLYVVKEIGFPSEHNNGKEDYVWEISAKQSDLTIHTFSGNNEEAPLHTDSHYQTYPEKYFSLSCIREALCGGGKTLILDFNKIIKELKSDKEREYIDELHKEYPVAIPRIYQTSKAKFIRVPIIGESPKIRYRLDIIKKGLKAKGVDKSSKKWNALLFLKEKIEFSKHIESFYLNKGDIIIMDNHRMLHGRTKFNDTNRLLYRIRFNPNYH